MGLKEFAENHIVPIGVCLLVAGAALGAVPGTIIQQTSESRIQARQEEIDSLNSKLGSVTRTVGNSTVSTLPVDEIIVTPSQAQDLSLTSLDYHRNDDFYSPAIDADDWKYSETDEAGVLGLQTELSRSDIARTYGEKFAVHRVHLWRGPETTELSMASGNLNTFPFIFLERFNADELGSLIVEKTGNDDLRNFVKDDPSGALFQLNIAAFVAGAGSSGNLSPVISDIQRTEKAVYCEITLAFRDVKIDGVQTDRFYIRQELIILSAGEDVVTIETSLPSVDRRSSVSPVLTDFLDGIRVVTS